MWKYSPPFYNMRFIIPILSWPMHIYIRVDSRTSCVSHSLTQRFLLRCFQKSKCPLAPAPIQWPEDWASDSVRGVFAFPLLALSTAHSSRANTPALFQSTRNISLCTICGDNYNSAFRLFSRNYFINHWRNIRKDFKREILRRTRVNTTKKDQLRPKISQEYMAAARGDTRKSWKAGCGQSEANQGLGRAKKSKWRPDHAETRWHVFLNYLADFMLRIQLFPSRKILHTNLKATGT